MRREQSGVCSAAVSASAVRLPRRQRRAQRASRLESWPLYSLRTYLFCGSWPLSSVVEARCEPRSGGGGGGGDGGGGGGGGQWHGGV
eukprot:1308565-Prymnesium_polylepis.2